MNKRRINESSMLIDELSISDNEKLKVYWDKNDGYVVEKIYNQGNDLWRTDFKKTFHDELSAKRYFSRAKKKFSVNESASDDYNKFHNREDIQYTGTEEFEVLDKLRSKYGCKFGARGVGRIEVIGDKADMVEKDFGYYKFNGELPKSVRESVEDKKIHKFEVLDDPDESMFNLFRIADEYFKSNPEEDRFWFEFDVDEFKKKVSNYDEKKLSDLAWDYYNDMVDLTHYLYPMYSMDNRNKKYYDPNATAFDKLIAVVRDKDYEDEENHLDESIYDDDYFKAESEIDGWAQSDADYEKKKAYNDFYEEVLDFGISRKYIKDLYDYYLKRYDYWHKEIYESMCKESVDDDASYNWLSEVIDRDVKFHYTDGGYTMQFESEKDYKKAKDLAYKHNFKGGKWFDEDLQFCDYHSTRVGMDYED